MAKKTKTAKTTTEIKTTSETPKAAPVPGPVLTGDLITQLRAAESIDAAVCQLAPKTTPRPRVNGTFALVENCAAPLPQRRGASLKVVAVAARLNRPFTIADITAELPTVKAAGYWTRRLAKTGHFAEVR